MTVSKDFQADAALLRRVADLWDVNEIMDGRGGVIEDEASNYGDRLREIATKCEQMSAAMFEPSLQLEKLAERQLSVMVEHIANEGCLSPETAPSLHLLALWLIQRRLVSAGRQALFGGGLSGLAAGLGSALAGKIGVEPPPETTNGGKDER